MTENDANLYITIIKIAIVAMIFYVIIRTVISCYRLTNVDFLDTQQIIDIINNDADGYMNSLTAYDLYARGVDNVDQYKHIVDNNVINLTLIQKLKIVNWCRQADKYIKLLQNDPISKFIDFAKLSDMKWRIAVVRGYILEDGYSHTRNDVIFLNDITISADTEDIIPHLIHEKVHAYEKLYPDDVYKWIRSYYKRVGVNSKMSVSNPDTDRIIYSKNGVIIDTRYNSSQPLYIDDCDHQINVDLDIEKQHPFEYLSYYIQQKIEYILLNSKND